MTDLENRRHALYRFYDSDGRLLYVGITADLGGRLNRHGDDKPWWSDVTRVVVEHHQSRTAVLAAERAAILDERPLHNIVHNRAGRSGPLAPVKATASTAPPMLQPGQVVALALDKWQCPVGLVVDSDREGALLQLYSWLTGYFSAGERWVRYREIRMLRFAELMPNDVAARLGYLVDPGERIFDMDPLAAFQDEWKPEPLTESDRREVERRRAIPNFVGPFLDPKPPRPAQPTPGVVPAVPDAVPDQNDTGTEENQL